MLTFEDVVLDLEGRSKMLDRLPGTETTRKGLFDIGFFSSRFFENLKKDPRRVIIVAGTNGKGSVCSTLESLLLDAGESVGFYSSPHLVEITERIRLNGRDVNRDDFVRAFENIQIRLGKDLLRDLTHFEMITLMAIEVFCMDRLSPAVDWVILEVGLGGMFDATNSVPHGIAAITTIDFDHTNILGNSRVEIARQKLGVITNAPKEIKVSNVFHFPFHHELTTHVQELKSGIGATWKESVAYELVTDLSCDDPKYNLKTKWGSVGLNLPGERGAQNTALALTIFDGLGFSVEKHISAVGRVHWPGRMQRIHWPNSQHRVFVSGDHNPQGIESLVEILKLHHFKKCHFVIGVGRDKDVGRIIAELKKVPGGEFYVTVTPFKGLELAEYPSNLGVTVGTWRDPVSACCAALEKANVSDDVVVVTGSLYLVGEILRHVRGLGPVKK